LEGETKRSRGCKFGRDGELADGYHGSVSHTMEGGRVEIGARLNTSSSSVPKIVPLWRENVRKAATGAEMKAIAACRGTRFGLVHGQIGSAAWGKTAFRKGTPPS
jgi:hypothetical protein